MSENKEKTETKEHSNICCYECCHCKKMFMLIVILLLAFIAGIMVGNCRPYYTTGNYYYAMHPQKRLNKIKKHKLHRGMHEVAPTQSQTPQPQPTSSTPDTPLNGFIIEVD